MLDGRPTRPAREALERYHYRQRDTDQAKQRLEDAEKRGQKLAEQPETIDVRDTALDTLTPVSKGGSWRYWSSSVRNTSTATA